MYRNIGIQAEAEKIFRIPDLDHITGEEKQTKTKNIANPCPHKRVSDGHM